MDETTQATRQPQPPPRTGVTIQRPTIVGILYLANIILGISVFVGLVLAYVWRNDADSQEWERTHFTYLIRTFWIGAAVFLGLFVLWFGAVFGFIIDQELQGGQADPPPAGIFLGFFGVILVWVLCAVWFCIRCILSLVRAADYKPMPRPGTWLF